MFRDNTVFVIGAGASAEFDMPVGSKLMETIAQNCVFRFEGHQMVEGVLPILDHYRQRYNMFSHYDVDRLNEKLNKMRQIAESIHMAESIDEYIFRYSGDPEVAEMGKLQIAYAIARAEKECILKTGSFDAGQNFHGADRTWVYEFAKALMIGVRVDDVDQIGANITIICFNYDRCIEHYLERAVVHAYPGVTDERARLIVDGINIIHPYGSLGLLRQFPFGSAENFEAMANNIITWSETIGDSQITEGIKNAMRDAETVVFLGFAFARQNMELLDARITERPTDIIRAFSTGYGLPQEAEQAYKENISRLYTPGLSQVFIDNVRIRFGAKCADFLQTNRYNLVQ
ncbi:hypothetical protein [Rhizobium leguminosarum]|uniref:hypothetical protein n=1 Tax=Rhizobium leguminosarum TaxID=384 RepID=UPI001441C3C2|nr:hypothetical protein [Rhizobium leguminosarum]NKK82627.1 hypothetical protein [Rhizobium leguminosarum bv. viciae]